MNLTTENVRKILDYNPDTGIFTWRSRSRDWFKIDGIWKHFSHRYAVRSSRLMKTSCAYIDQEVIGHG
jgi:DUF971 family protein